MCYDNSGVFIFGESQVYLHFQFRLPPPSQGRPRGGAGGLEGTLECGLVCCYVKNKTDVNFESTSIETS